MHLIKYLANKTNKFASFNLNQNTKFSNHFNFNNNLASKKATVGLKAIVMADVHSI